MSHETSQITPLKTDVFNKRQTPNELDLSFIEGANHLAVIHAKPTSWLGQEYGYAVPLDMDLISRGFHVYQPELPM